MGDQSVPATQILSLIIPVLSILLGGFAGWCAVVFKMGKYQEKVDHLVQDKEKIGTKIDNLRTDVDRLNEFKISAQKFIDSKIYQAQSQLQLTEIGKELIENSGFTEIFEHEKDNLVALLEQKNPKTRYDVQEKARAMLDTMQDYPAFAPIKTHAFSSGKDIGQILRAGGIMLRDYYLAKHPEIAT